MTAWSGGYFTWAPYKSVAARRADAAREIAAAARRGHAMAPVAVTGRKIAHTFWGQAWCDNLERYRDFAYRLERGRSYLRSGSVIDLQIDAGEIAAQVSGSSLYDVAIEINAVKRDAWRAIQRDCAGGIGSRIDLLGGKLSQPVMARLCADRTGLFPDPSAIRFRCSCPDHATMCKHVAAAMYGVGARLDRAPELLFTLRRVSLDELLASAVTELPATPSAARVLASDGLAALFGIELTEATAAPAAAARGRKPSRTSGATRAAAATATPKLAGRSSSKPRAQPASASSRSARNATPARSASQPRRISQARPASQAKAAVQPRPVAPAKSASTVKAAARAEPASPVMPVSPAKPASRAKPTAPAKAASLAEPASWAKPAPWAKPASPAKAAAQPRPASLAKPAARPRSASLATPTTPVKPTAPVKPTTQPRSASLAKPTAPVKPTASVKRTAPVKPASLAKQLRFTIRR